MFEDSHSGNSLNHYAFGPAELLWQDLTGSMDYVRTRETLCLISLNSRMYSIFEICDLFSSSVCDNLLSHSSSCSS